MNVILFQCEAKQAETNYKNKMVRLIFLYNYNKSFPLKKKRQKYNKIHIKQPPKFLIIDLQVIFHNF